MGVGEGVAVAVGVDVDVRVAVGVCIGLGVLLGLGAASTWVGWLLKRDMSTKKMLTLRPDLNKNIFMRLSSFLPGHSQLAMGLPLIFDAIQCSEQTDSHYSILIQAQIRIGGSRTHL